MERKIGETFHYDSIKLMVDVARQNFPCPGCFFYGGKQMGCIGHDHSITGACTASGRKDRTNVVFVKSNLPETSDLPAPPKKPDPQKEDCVNHPKHYTSHPSGVECIQITECMNFCIGNAVKYLWRAGEKHEEGMTDREKQIEDLKKADWYIQREIKRLRNE